MDLLSVKQKFGITGNSPLLDRAIIIAMQVAPTDLSVLITGESGTGKEVFPKIIHHLSPRKHNSYIAVNCGAIPEGTIDSELFGHEKGSFTGAHETRKGYFEEANGGTIFLDEVAELPLATQARLLRVLETGEYIRVGASKVFKTNVRIVAATNVDILQAVQLGKFREDLYYRLNSVPIHIPPLRERKEDIILLFRKFASDFAEKYRMPPIQLDEEAQNLMINYRWQGNIRQLKNITEQISIIEQNRIITANTLKKYLPAINERDLPVLFKNEKYEGINERELLYKVLFYMKKDIFELKKLVSGIIENNINNEDFALLSKDVFQNVYEQKNTSDVAKTTEPSLEIKNYSTTDPDSVAESEIIEENLSLQKTEIELIKKALERHKGKRKEAAKDLGISERTLYRKIKEYNIDK